MTSKKILYQGIMYDDVLLIPRYSKILPREVKFTSRRIKNVALNIPIIADGGIKQTAALHSAMRYSGCESIAETKQNAIFNQITGAGLQKAVPHNVNNTKRSAELFCIVR
jgi:IMP dehydrogenase/GMP reductase